MVDNAVRMLVVASESRDRHAVRDVLNQEGWHAMCASTAGECEELLTTQNIHLVFCERDLTDGTYRDVLAITRSLSRNVRLVVTSRLADWSEYLEALDDGAFDLIASPTQRLDIARVIRQAQREDQETGAPVAAGKAGPASAGNRGLSTSRVSPNR